MLLQKTSRLNISKSVLLGFFALVALFPFPNTAEALCVVTVDYSGGGTLDSPQCRNIVSCESVDGESFAENSFTTQDCVISCSGCTYNVNDPIPVPICRLGTAYGCDAPPASCTYSGAISWAPGCYANGSWSATSPNGVTVTNTASGYTGSGTFTCQSDGSWAGPTNLSCTATTCTNGATNFPTCNNICTNGYTNYPTCGPTSCTNGATNFPACDNICTNGYTNYPTCGPATCSYSGALSWGAGCYANGSWSATGGGDVTIGNQVSGYSGSVTFTCSTSGAWGGPTASPCVADAPATCTNTSATNYGQPLPCTFCPAGQTWDGSSCVVPPPGAPTASLSVSPNPAAYGSRSTITWGSTNATSCTAGGAWSNQGTLSGSGLTDPLYSDTTFTFQCSGAGGTSALQSVTVVVTPPALIPPPSDSCPGGSCGGTGGDSPAPGQGGGSPAPVVNAPSATLTATPSTIDVGQSTTLTWSSSDANSCAAAGGFSTGNATSNSTGVSVSPSTTSTYQISCSGAGGSATSNATVTVLNPKVNSFRSSVPRADIGDVVTISWDASGVQSCAVSGSGGFSATGLTGSREVVVGNQELTYTLTCQTNTTPLKQSLIVRIKPPFTEF